MIREGLAHYKEMCQQCHGGPGIEETELVQGLNPPAPNLVKHAEHLSAKEIFWITKHGIKMTGMPAWGKTHSDEKIWAITAAIISLPKISISDYNAYRSKNEIERSKTDSDSHQHHN